MILFTWMTRFTMLGAKFDECLACGAVCRHVVGRRTRWAGIFYLPLLLIGIEHGMLCTACGSWTGIPWRQARSAVKSGLLPLNRDRSAAQAAYEIAAPGEPPLSPLAFDRMAVNPNRGPWDLYVKAWPVLVAVAVVVTPIAVTEASKPGGPMHQAAAHTCWLATDGSISGCRMADGSVEGSQTPTTTVCYFDEPLADGDITLKCTK